MRLCQPLPKLSAKELFSIVEADWKRNYSKTPQTVEDCLQALYLWMETKLPVGYYENVIFLAVPVSAFIVEFHSINGTSVRKLLQATHCLLKDLKAQGFLYAETYFREFRVSDMAKHLKFPYVTDFSPSRGEDRKYCTTFFLGE